MDQSIAKHLYMHTKKIAIIVFHFGQQPWFLPLFVQSCGTNPTVDFLFFNDGPPLPNRPLNVRHIPFSLNEFNQLATDTLGFGVSVQNPYKLCDFKPAFGTIFHHWLKGYCIWGYVDTDVILGDVRAFFTDDLLDAHDVFCVKDRYPAGFFTLLKNKPSVNQLFTKSKYYQQIFTAQENFMFDECSTAYAEVEDGIPIGQVPCATDSLLHLLDREKEQVTTFFDYCVIEGIPGELEWNKGRLLYKKQYEVLLYHLSDFKQNRFAQKKVWRNIPAAYYIDQYGMRRKGILDGLRFWWTEKAQLRWHLHRRYLRIQWAKRWGGKPVEYLPVGDYYYMQEKITVARTEKQHNYLQTLQGKRRIVQMPFIKNQFFLPTTQQIFEWDGIRLHELLLDGRVTTFSPLALLPIAALRAKNDATALPAEAVAR